MAPPEVASDDSRALGRWLAHHLPNAEALICHPLARAKLGMSNDTRIVDAEWIEHGQQVARRFVLRCGSDGPPIHPLQTDATADSVDLQYRVMAALAAEGSVPVARLLPYEADRRWLGRPFFLMEHVEGWAPADHPAYTQEGPFADGPPGLRRSFLAHGLRILAVIHKIDWRKAGLSWLDRAPGDGPRMPAQIALWRTYCAPIFAETPFPLLARALGWLAINAPAEPPPSLVWGDARPQNMIYDDALRPKLVMDWEGAAILPAEADIAYWAINDRMVHERLGVRRLEGTPERHEYYEMHAAELGRSLVDLPYYEVFAVTMIVATMFKVLAALDGASVAHGLGTPVDNYFSQTLDLLLAGQENSG
jgi:aminoglycoside phosphotransferase (APT) family kinase protein